MEQQVYQSHKYRIRQILAGEGLEPHAGCRARPDQEQWRQMDLDTQVKYRIRQFLAEEGLERHVGMVARPVRVKWRQMGLDTQ